MTPPDDVLERIEQIRETHEGGLSRLPSDCDCPECDLFRSDVPYLLSLVEEVGEALNRVSITPDYMEHEPEECREAAKLLFALRDAAQEKNDDS